MCSKGDGKGKRQNRSDRVSTTLGDSYSSKQKFLLQIPPKNPLWMLRQSQAAPPAGLSMTDQVDLRSLGETMSWESRWFEASHGTSTCCTWTLQAMYILLLLFYLSTSSDAKTKGHNTHHTYAAKHSSTWNTDGHIQCSWAMVSPELCLGSAGTVITS